jgi:hypothetical protein
LGLRGGLGEAGEEGALFGRAASAAVQHVASVGNARPSGTLRRDLGGALLKGDAFSGRQGVTTPDKS